MNGRPNSEPIAPAAPQLGFFEHRGRRVAYATSGAGPPLLCDFGRLHHLDVFWRYPPYRRLVESLARDFTVIRLDRPGCGLSERAKADFTLDAELALFDGLLGELGLARTAVLASMSSSPVMIAVAALRPERVSRLALFGGWASSRAQAANYRGALDMLLRTHLELATDVLARSTAAGCEPGAMQWLAAAYREAASGEVIARWLGETVELDVRPLLDGVRCPTLVLYRRGDPVVGFEQVREVAAGIHDAVLLPLDGGSGLIWEGDTEAFLGPVTRFLLASASPGAAAAERGLTRREREVAQLAALGLTNGEIAGRLRIGRRTVESHLERARGKLGLSSRVELAAWAAAAADGQDEGSP